MKQSILIAIIILCVAVIITALLPGCYNERKATSQFSRAAVAYPEIPAEFCATTFPAKDSLIKGDSVTTTDTLYIEGEITTGTLLVNDTLRIITIRTLPGKTITNTVHIRDTIIRENTAAVRSAEIERGKAMDLLVLQTAATGKAKDSRNIWRIIALCSLAVNVIGIYLKISKISIPKIKI